MRSNLILLYLALLFPVLMPITVYGSTGWGNAPVEGKYYFLARQGDTQKVLTPRYFRYTNNSVLIFMPNNPQVGLSVWKFVGVKGKPDTYQLLNEEYGMGIDLSMNNDADKGWADVVLWNDLKGVNTQDTDPITGRSIRVETMLKDITMMKQANINCVRTSHYPRQAKMMAIPGKGTALLLRHRWRQCDQTAQYLPCERGHWKARAGIVQQLPDHHGQQDEQHAGLLIETANGKHCGDEHQQHHLPRVLLVR
jgi:hypothetical protein